VISDFAYTHDAAGNILSKTTDFGLIQYGYDALDRLVLADYDWKADETFAYDAVGNRTADAEHPVWHYDAANQLLAYGAGPHDPAGQTPPTVPAFTFAYDANGSTVSKTDPAAGTADQYGYSFDNRMREVWRNGELVARYFYDHLSQRIRKDLFTDGSPTGTTWFVYGAEGLLTEIDSEGLLNKKYLWCPDYLWGTNPLWRRSSSGEIFYILTDHLFTPQSEVDSTVTKTWISDLNAFGFDSQAQPLQNSLRFPGQYIEEENDLFFNFQRYYDPSIGLYRQVDPANSDLTKSLYQYASNNPVMYIDPYGLEVLVCHRPLVSDPFGLEPGEFFHLFIVINGRDYGFFCKGDCLSGPGEVRGPGYETRIDWSKCFIVKCIDEEKLIQSILKSKNQSPRYSVYGGPSRTYEPGINCQKWVWNRLREAAIRPCCEKNPIVPYGSEPKMSAQP